MSKIKKFKFDKVYCIYYGSLLHGVFRSFRKAYKHYLFLEKILLNRYTFCSISSDLKLRVLGGLLYVR